MPFPTHFQPYPHDTYNMLSLASKKRMKMLNSKKSIFGPNKIQKNLENHVGVHFLFRCGYIGYSEPDEPKKKIS